MNIKLRWNLVYFMGIFCSTFIALASEEILNPLQADCQKLGGQLSRVWQCPQSNEIEINENEGFFCHVKSKNGTPIVFDGCSTPSDTMPYYTDFFYEACKRHDICYHNTQDHTLNGKHKCDLSFYNGMLELCKKHKGTQSIWSECGDSASLFYQSVDLLGNTSFHCSNTPLNPSEYQHFYNRSEY